MESIEKHRSYRLLIGFILFALIAILGACGTCFSPLRNSDLAAIKVHKKYPLKVAVITTDIENYKFTPDRKRDAYRTYSRGKRFYYSFDAEIEPACKEFFPLLFHEVDFIDESDSENDTYELIIKLIPRGIKDFSKDIRKSAELKLDMGVDFVGKDEQSIFVTIIRSTGTSGRGSGKKKDEDKRWWNYDGAMSNAVRGVFIKLGEVFTQHPNALDEYAEYVTAKKQRELEKKTLPATLIATVQYSDKSCFLPNNTLDAGEDSGIMVSVTNKGKGTAFDVKLNTESDYEHIDFPKTISLGDIQPGKSKDVEIKVKAGLDLADGTVPFRIVCKEKRGYDSKQYVLNVPAARLERPEITITRYRINDGNTGLARGNGNGIPENGETVELIPFVKNTGVGDAIRVKLSVTSINSGIEVKQGTVTIPQIQPGRTATGNLAFFIPRTFKGGEIKLSLEASDVRGGAETRKAFAISMESHRPLLVYDYRIIDRNGNGVMENGEEGEIEIIPANKGKMDAMDLRIDLACGDISFSKTRTDIGRISANTRYVPLRFPFKVPRTLEKDSVDVRVQFDQKDFAGLTDSINIPIRLVMPDFRVTHQILDPNNNGIIEQGETVDLIVRVQNRGNLDADNVVLTLNVDQPGVLVTSKKEARIGKLAAGGQSNANTFTIHVQRRAKVGNLPLHFTITQKDFSKKEISLALNVSEERPEVIQVAAQKKPHKVSPVLASVSNSPPLIAIAAPRDGKRVASESQMLTGTVVDDKGVASIEIILNRRRLGFARGIAVVQKPVDGRKEQNFRIKIPLRLGKNVITVTALDIENLSKSRSITVFRDSERGEIWAAVIGLNGYQNPDIPSLNYAKNDAQAFADYLRENMKLDRDHLFELYDSEATVRNMKSVLGTRLRRRADRPEDTVYIFFAGHGAPEKDPESMDGDGITKYMLAYDSDPQDLYSTAMPMDEVARILSRIKAERIIFIADSCYSGGAGGRTILAQGIRANLSDTFLERIAQSGKGRIILSSSSANEVSQESDELKHGYFTYYLLMGLKGEADLDGDRLIDIDEIYRYLNKWVPERTKGGQHPVKKGQAEGLVIVGRTD